MDPCATSAFGEWVLGLVRDSEKESVVGITPWAETNAHQSWAFVGYGGKPSFICVLQMRARCWGRAVSKRSAQGRIPSANQFSLRICIFLCPPESPRSILARRIRPALKRGKCQPNANKGCTVARSPLQRDARRLSLRNETPLITEQSSRADAGERWAKGEWAVTLCHVISNVLLM
jgi:hypothetical protein